MQENKFKSLIHFHFIVFIFGFTAIIGSLISIDSVELVWFRMLIATICLLIFSIFFPFGKISKGLFLKLFFAGFLISMHWVFFFKAIKVSNVSITLSVLSLGAFITSFLEPFFYKKKIVMYEVLLGLLVAFGTIIIFKTQFHYIEGIIYASISVLLSVFFTLMNGKLVGKTSSFTISFYELLSGLILIISGFIKNPIGNLLTRLSGLNISILMISILIFAHKDWLITTKLFTSEQIFLLIGGIYFLIKGNRA